MRHLLASLLLASTAMADVVHLKSGGRIEGTVTEEGDNVVVNTGHGTITLSKEEVLRVEKKEFKAPEKPVFTKATIRLRDSFAQPFYGFKIYLPAGWQKAADKEARKIAFFGPKEGGYQPHMTLNVDVTRQGLVEMINALKGAYAKRYQEVTFPQEDASSVRGREAYQFMVFFVEGMARMRSVWTVVRWEDRTYTLGFSCPDAWFDRYYPAVDASMRSLRLFAFPAASLEKRKEFDAQYNKGYGLNREGKTAEALKCFVKAAQLVPEYPEIHRVVGQLNVKLRNFADAEKAFKKAQELSPEDYDPHFEYGVILLQQLKLDEAIAALSAAIRIDPGMEPALTNLGVAYLQHEQAQKAVETLQKALLADPESVPAHYNLGVAHEKMGRPKEAEAEFREVLKLDPKHQGAKDGLARLKK